MRRSCCTLLFLQPALTAFVALYAYAFHSCLPCVWSSLEDTTLLARRQTQFDCLHLLYRDQFWQKVKHALPLLWGALVACMHMALPQPC